MLRLIGHRKAVRCVAYSPDGSQIASGSEDGTLRLWSIAGGEQLAEATFDDSVDSVTFTSDGKFIVCGLASGAIRACKSNGAQTPWQVMAHDHGVISCLGLAPSGRVISIGWDRALLMWQPMLPVRHEVAILPTVPKAIAVSTDGLTLAVACVNSIAFVNMNRQGLIRTGPTESQPTSIAISPDKSIFAYGTGTGQVCVLESGSGKQVQSFQAHDWVVFGLVFGADGRQLITGGVDGKTRTWDVTRGELVGEYQWHENWLTCMSISPEGSTIATGSNDCTIAVWDVVE